MSGRVRRRSSTETQRTQRPKRRCTRASTVSTAIGSDSQPNDSDIPVESENEDNSSEQLSSEWEQDEEEALGIDFDDGFWNKESTSRPNIINEEQPIAGKTFNAALARAIETLGISDKDMTSILDQFHIPHHCDKLYTTGKNPKPHTASSVTRSQLEGHGEWVYEKPTSPQPLATSQVYKVDAGERIGMTIKPNFFVTNAPSELNEEGNVQRIPKAPRDFQARISAGISRCQREIEGTKDTPSVLALPDDWLQEEPGPKPVTPGAWKQIQDPRFVTPPPGETKIEPSPSLTVYGPATPTTVKPASKTAKVEDSPIALQASPTVPMDKSGVHEGENTATPSSSSSSKALGRSKADITNLPLDSVVHFRDPEQWQLLQAARSNIGSTLAEKLGLSLSDKPSINQIERFEAALQPFCDLYEIKSSKKNLREIFGTAEDRLNAGHHTVLTYPNIVYLPRSSIPNHEANPLAADVVVNEYPESLAVSSARLIYDWATLLSLVPKHQSTEKVKSKGKNTKRKNKATENVVVGKIIGEMEVERQYGSLIPRIFDSAGRNQITCTELSFILPMRLFNINPRPDFAVQLSGGVFASEDWPSNFRPVIFSADAKKTRDFDQVEAQLAFNSYATLILFILTYLDTRVRDDQRLHAFLWIPAVVYHPEGFKIFAHHPQLVAVDNGDWRWKFSARMISNQFDTAFVRGNDHLRMKGYTAMLKLNSHSTFLQKELENWARNPSPEAKSILDKFVARAKLEAGDRNWILKAARKAGTEREREHQAIAASFA